MGEKSHSIRVGSILARNLISLRSVLVVTNLLLLALINAGQPAPASAEIPPLSRTPYVSRYQVGIAAPRGPFCPKNDYDFKAALWRFDYGVLRGQPVTRRVTLGPEAMNSSSSDASVGTISPPSAPGGIVLRGGSAHFKFHANKPGMTDLKFTAYSVVDPDVPSPLSATQTVEVTECIYRVTMHYTYSLTEGGITITTAGDLITTLDRQGEEYTGSGTVGFRDLGFSSPDCPGTGHFYNFAIPTDIHGTIQNNKLTLNFSFRPAEEGGSVTTPCGGANMRAVNMDLNRAGIHSVTGPASGWGEPLPIGVAGRMTATVERFAR